MRLGDLDNHERNFWFDDEEEGKGIDDDFFWVVEMVGASDLSFFLSEGKRAEESDWTEEVIIFEGKEVGTVFLQEKLMLGDLQDGEDEEEISLANEWVLFVKEVGMGTFRGLWFSFHFDLQSYCDHHSFVEWRDGAGEKNPLKKSVFAITMELAYFVMRKAMMGDSVGPDIDLKLPEFSLPGGSKKFSQKQGNNLFLRSFF